MTRFRRAGWRRACKTSIGQIVGNWRPPGKDGRQEFWEGLAYILAWTSAFAWAMASSIVAAPLTTLLMAVCKAVPATESSGCRVKGMRLACTGAKVVLTFWPA